MRDMAEKGQKEWTDRGQEPSAGAQKAFVDLPRELAGVATGAAVRAMSIMYPTKPEPGVTDQAKEDTFKCNFRKGEE